jgi:KaiC/GvpD/RAD55 family RecA-like ATPase
MEKVATGIPGLDALMDSGIPKGFNVVIMGRPGTGKTIFGLQYLYNGALKGEGGLYITVDANSNLVREQGQTFGWDIKKLEDEKKLCILDIPLNRQLRFNLFKLVENKIKEYGVKRIVFDSLSSFMFNINQFNMQLPNIDNLTTISKEEIAYLEEDIGVRSDSVPKAVQRLKPDPQHYDIISVKRIVYLLFKEFSSLGTTNLVITSASSKNPDATVDGVSEFVSDGVIKLEAVDLGGGPARVVKIVKLRKIKNSMEANNFEITDKGIVVT